MKQMLMASITKMVEERQQVKYLFYPDHFIYSYWDTLMTILLIFSCFITPTQIALFEDLTTTW